MSKTAKLRCECGGGLRDVELETFDFTPYAGLPVRLERVPGYRCDQCDGVTLPGEIINAALRRVALWILEQAPRLSAYQARYLRRYLRLTQAELAGRMGVNRVTVAKWESGEDAISPAHDLVLRALVVASLVEQLPSEQTAAILGHVRQRAPVRLRTLRLVDIAEPRLEPPRRPRRARPRPARRAGA